MHAVIENMLVVDCVKFGIVEQIQQVGRFYHCHTCRFKQNFDSPDEIGNIRYMSENIVRME